MSEFNFDMSVVAERSQELPICCFPNDDPDIAFRTPGNCLKSKERKPGGWYAYFGRLHSYSTNKVVVVNSDSLLGPPFVWTGTAEEYYETWMVD